MARKVCTLALIVILSAFVGCGDPGRSRLVAPDIRPPTSVIPPGSSETDLVEEMTVNRQGYKSGLERLVAYYTKTGNNEKLRWAQKELTALITMPRYEYIQIIDTGEAGWKATDPIPEADDLYFDALAYEKAAGPILKNENQLRLALAKYNELIKKYNSSDKIDDAAFKAGAIYEHFKDYDIAITSFKRAIQWDPDTPYPARFRAARILDQRLHRNSEALQLYQQAVKTEGQYDKYREWKEYAEKRIRELQKIDE